MNVKGAHGEADVHCRVWQLLTQPSQDGIAWVSQPKHICHGPISQDLEPLKPSFLAYENRLDGCQTASPLLGKPSHQPKGLGRVISVIGVGWTVRWKTHTHWVDLASDYTKLVTWTRILSSLDSA